MSAAAEPVSLSALPPPLPRPATLDQLAAIPDEEIWLAKQKSARTRRAYKLDVRHFMNSLGIGADQLRSVDHRAVIAWERMQREQEGAATSTIRRRLAALSSLFKHLSDMASPAAIRSRTLSGRRLIARKAARRRFSKAQARKLLDAPAADTLAGLRDRAILSVGVQIGFRRAEIAALNIGDLHQDRSFDAVRVTRKGGRRDSFAINPQAAQRIRAYLKRAGHGAEHDKPLFRPVRGNQKKASTPPDAWTPIRLTASSGNMPPGSGSTAATRALVHSMRATFITTALENGAQLEDVQKAAGHRACAPGRPESRSAPRNGPSVSPRNAPERGNQISHDP